MWWRRTWPLHLKYLGFEPKKIREKVDNALKMVGMYE
jgi:energy-coupling factor transporter ATP-binding protein EcfA2